MTAQLDPSIEAPAATFDTVVGMYLITVVPDPEKVMLELSRVTKPGGTVIILAASGPLGYLGLAFSLGS